MRCSYSNNLVKIGPGVANLICVEVTKECNLSYYHCFNAAEKLGNALNFSNLVNLSESLNNIKPRKVILTGGEPLTYNKLIEIIDFFI